MKTVFSDRNSSLFQAVAQIGIERGYRICVVGGMVRDLLLSQRLLDHDVDLMVEGNAAEVATEFARQHGGTVRQHERFLTAKVSGIVGIPGIDEVDFATARTERYERPGALPRVTPATIEEDLARRDFSINACAIEVGELVPLLQSGRIDRDTLAPLIIDLFGGLSDLTQRLIRVLHPKSFQDDPTRIFRAARYAARLRGALDSSTRVALDEELARGGVEAITAARIWNEWKRICEEHDPIHVLELLKAWGVFSHLCQVPKFDPARAQRCVIDAQQGLSWSSIRGTPEFALAVLRYGGGEDLSSFRREAGISKQLYQTSDRILVQLKG